jgi:acyl-CoA synthetase (AMP-forming)/AMP-acid ligase II
MNLAALEKFDLAALRMITNTAGGAPRDRTSRAARALPARQLFSMYGLTECKRVTVPAARAARHPAHQRRARHAQRGGVAGRRVGRRLPDGSTGELVIRGSNVMRGYWRSPPRRRAA